MPPKKGKKRPQTDDSDVLTKATVSFESLRADVLSRHDREASSNSPKYVKAWEAHLNALMDAQRRKQYKRAASGGAEAETSNNNKPPPRPTKFPCISKLCAENHAVHTNSLLGMMGQNKHIDGHDYVVPVLPEVGKKYHENYLVECQQSHGERPCSKGSRCECVRMAKAHGVPHLGFVGKEFLLPNEEAQAVQMGRYPVFPKMCLLCNRLATARQFFNLLSMSKESTDLLQDHRVRVNVEGEYSLEDCITKPENGLWVGIVAPVIHHQRNKYEYKQGKSGLKYIKQVKMGFRNA
ncbi:MAG: hypothetical protein CMI16_02920 [Opitutaceae bacterium]|nr:hypothetical protein [Opitutaceae bacterium]